MLCVVAGKKKNFLTKENFETICSGLVLGTAGSTGDFWFSSIQSICVYSTKSQHISSQGSSQEK